MPTNHWVRPLYSEQAKAAGALAPVAPHFFAGSPIEGQCTSPFKDVMGQLFVMEVHKSTGGQAQQEDKTGAAIRLRHKAAAPPAPRAVGRTAALSGVPGAPVGSAACTARAAAAPITSATVFGDSSCHEAAAKNNVLESEGRDIHT
jgi:hypothetical protein